MKPRKTKYLKKILAKKSFQRFPEKHHHEFYYLEIDGIKQNIYTYFSHGKKEYDGNLMGQIKKQLKFPTSKQAEQYFDCPMSGNDYVNLLRTIGVLPPNDKNDDTINEKIQH